MFPLLVKIGSLEITTHGALSLLGIFFALLLAFRLADLTKLNRAGIFDIALVSVLFGFIGAKVTYFVLYREQFDSYFDILKFWEGGLVSLGGFIFGGIAFFVLLKKYSQPLLRWLDIFAITFPFGLFWGRIGDLFAGEYAGRWSSLFPIFNHQVPIPLFEAALCLVIFSIFMFLFLKKRDKIPQGIFLSSLILFYPLGRIIIDFWRDEKPLVAFLSLGQIVSLVLIVLSFILFNKYLKGENYGSTIYK